jgi:hypothetical protein
MLCFFLKKKWIKALAPNKIAEEIIAAILIPKINPNPYVKEGMIPKEINSEIISLSSILGAVWQIMRYTGKTNTKANTKKSFKPLNPAITKLAAINTDSQISTSLSFFIFLVKPQYFIIS